MTEPGRDHQPQRHHRRTKTDQEPGAFLGELGLRGLVPSGLARVTYGVADLAQRRHDLRRTDPVRPPAPAMGESYEPEPPVGAVYAAVEFDCSPELLALLLDHGADPDGSGQTGWSALRLAVRRIRPDLADLLRSHGAQDRGGTGGDVDRLLGACTAGDRPAAERLLAARPTLLDDIAAELGDALTYVAERGATEGVRLMLDLGVPVGLRGGDGSTALHKAAGAGSVDVVRLLLDRGADLEVRDETFDGTPLSWATVGSGLHMGDDPRPDRVATVRLLLDAGAATDGAYVTTKPPSPDVAAVLADHGIAPAGEDY